MLCYPRGVREEGIMKFNMHLMQEEKLIGHLRSLKVEGEVEGKKTIEPSGDQPEKHIILIRFGDRIIEKVTEESEFKNTKIGDKCQFIPPVPDRDSCRCHLFICLLIGVSLGMFAIWVISSYLSVEIVTSISIVVAAWVGIIIWAKIHVHEQNKCVQDLKKGIVFFEHKI